MSVTVRVQTVIARPRAEVFDYVATVDHDVVWTGGLVEATATPSGRLATGSRVERVSKFLGRRMVYVIDITEVIEGELVAMHTSSGPFPMTVRYELEDADDGTVMRIFTTGDPKGFYALTGPLLTAAVRRQITNDLATLKDILESQVRVQ